MVFIKALIIVADHSDGYIKTTLRDGRQNDLEADKYTFIFLSKASTINP